jgi:hypothetical protein
MGIVIAIALAAGLVGGVATAVLMDRMAPPEDGNAGRIAVLDQRISQQADTIREMKEELNELRHRRDEQGSQQANAGNGDTTGPPVTDTGNTFGGYADLMLLSARRLTNEEEALRTIRSSRLVEVFGQPAAELGTDCTPPTSARLKRALVVKNVGPFRTQLVRPAADSVARIMAKVKEDEPGLYENLKTYGGLCARLIRGSTASISRHSFGVAIDVSVGGTLDAMGDGKTQFGLILLAEYFQAEGWLWGAAFGREDSMHFEVSSDLFERWVSEGLI